MKIKPNTKESRALQQHKEAKQRAETLQKMNKDLEIKISYYKQEMDLQSLDHNNMQEKHSHQVIGYSKRLDKMKEEQAQ